jgi:hypothetical protein
MSDEKVLKERKLSELTRGERPSGDKIGVYKDAEYAIFKDRINPFADGYVDLLLTRSFYNKMFLKNYGREYIFNSSDSKTGNLIGKYGLDIMGINQAWFEQRQRDIYRLTLVQMIKINNKIG